MKVTASIVLFNTPIIQIRRLLNCLENSNYPIKVWIIDNSPVPMNFPFHEFQFVEYIKSINYGYGYGHNIALKKNIESSDFHFIFNPDIYFDKFCLKRLLDRISRDDEIGLLMPKILYPNGRLQFVCKKLPTPFDLLIRRFPIPYFSSFIEKNNSKYELRFTNYCQEMNVPNLSGCFMLVRSSALRSVGIFDTRYFMYLEDVDLSRRIHSQYKTIYFPEVSVFHEHAKSSYSSLKMLLLHISSVIKYFNKWGWFFDKERTFINSRLIKSINHLHD